MDIIRMIRSRTRRVNITVYPVRVQGDGAAGEIASAIEHLNRLAAHDIIICGRGGGSLEDLWAFNEERVARAIYVSKIPVISAVGHEIDITISDMVADIRALTPTHAGEMVVRDDEILADQVLEKAAESLRNVLRIIDNARFRARNAARSLSLRTPVRMLREKVQRLDDTAGRLTTAISHMLVVSGQQLKGVSGRLSAVSPLAVLERGYSVTLGPDGSPVRGVGGLKDGDEISTIAFRGKLISRITSVSSEDHSENLR